MRTNYVIITVDYETWQPIPNGMEINWERDLIENANKLMDACEQSGAKLTFMVEMCEYFWLKDNLAEVAVQIEEQIRDMVRRGHDVQLHLHPNWMPDAGAKYGENGWEWNWKYASAATYPHDFTVLLNKCKNRLEEIVHEVDPTYRVRAYRAGAYRIQPFPRVAHALTENRITCDTSVYKGGKSEDRGYNFKKCKYYNSPYFASKQDPQLESETQGEKDQIIELPITTWRSGLRWFLDNEEALKFGKRFIFFHKKLFANTDNFFVMVGHSKGNHDYESIQEQLDILKNYPDLKFTTISRSFDAIYSAACKKSENALKSIHEVKRIMDYLYDLIEPNAVSDCGYLYPYDVLRKRESLCYGYSITLYQILKQYGYCVKCITAFAMPMPRGRGKDRIDTHELVELKLDGEKYILDPTVNTIKPCSFRSLLRDPQRASKKGNPDSRYKERDYQCYDTAFFYRRIKYYYKAIPAWPILDGGGRPYIRRMLGVLFFHILPRKMKRYNIYRHKNISRSEGE